VGNHIANEQMEMDILERKLAEMDILERKLARL